MLGSSLHHPNQNHLLAALPAIELGYLIPHLELTHMPLGDALCEAGDRLPYAYFPTSAIISLHYILENGASSEIASVGREGMLGVSLLMGSESIPSWATIQADGYGFRLTKDRCNAYCCATPTHLLRKSPRLAHATGIIRLNSSYADGSC